MFNAKVVAFSLLLTPLFTPGISSQQLFEDQNQTRQLLLDYESSNEIYRSRLSAWINELNSSSTKDSLKKHTETDDVSQYAEAERSRINGFTLSDSASYMNFREQELLSYLRYMKEVSDKWGSFRGNTPTEWIKYSQDYESRSYVDFENGTVVIETVVEEDSASPSVAHERLEVMRDSLLVEKDDSGLSILANQVDEADAQRAITEVVEMDTTIGEDGISRVRYATAFPLVPDHLIQRAERFLPIVRKYVNEYALDQSLVLAIIHTESYFNPLARSWANAYGLMQIVPRFAGRETYQVLYGQDLIPKPKYLYNPENNVRHGTCYLNLLKTTYWKEVNDAVSNDYLVICSYNCGPTSVRKIVSSQFGSNLIFAEQQLYDVLVRQTPEETRHYLQKVTERRKMWVEHFGG